VFERGDALAARGLSWLERQDPASRKGATIGWLRRFQAANGQLYAVLLTAYIFITLLPAVIVMGTYLERNPAALADHVIHRLGLTGTVASLVHEVLAGAGENQLGSTLIAVADVIVFGLGVGRVLQIAHARSWGIDLGKRAVADQIRYLATLLGLMAMALVYLIERKVLAGQPSWIEWVLLPVWGFVLLSYFVLVPRALLHRQVSIRDIVPGAVFTVLALVGMRIASLLVLTHWLQWYSKYYGGLGVVMALFFWLMVAATILIVAAALSPALAERRDLLRARAAAA
jgi:membrane protein